jgi:hypothetical protein
MKERLELKARVEKMCVEKGVEDEVMHGLEELFAADPKAACAAALDKLTVLQCSSCSQPFCGGRIDCQEDDSLDITRNPLRAVCLRGAGAARGGRAQEGAGGRGGPGGHQAADHWVEGACRKQ